MSSNDKRLIDQTNFKKIVQDKLRQASDNQESLLMALDKLDRPVSSRDLEQFLKVQAVIHAKEKFEKLQYAGEVDGLDIDSYVSKYGRSMDLRTIQRWLKTFLMTGYVVKSNNKYVLSITGKRELQFREYAQAYGIISLNEIMHFNFPTMNTLDGNLANLVEIFGIYVVYAMIEAARLIVANKEGQEKHWHSSFFGDASNFRDGKFREEKLVHTWIKDIFNPWYMLNMFLTAIFNSENDGKIGPSNTKKQQILMKQRLEEELSSRINGVPIESILKPKINTQEQEFPPSTFDLMVRRASDSYSDSNRNKYLHYFNIRSTWWNDDGIAYEPDSEKIEKLKNSLHNQYPVYSGCLQKIIELFYSK